MQKIIIQPCSDSTARNNYNRTIQNQVSLKEVESYLSADELKTVKGIFPDEKLRIWGVVDGKKEQNLKNWKKINKGDVVVFTWDKAVRSRAIVSGKLQNDKISKKLWDDEKFKNLYLLSEIENVVIAYSEFNKLLGYDTGYNYQGFSVLSDEKSIAALEYFEIGQTSYTHDISETEFDNAVKNLVSATTLDRKTIGYQRTEQSFLRNKLFGEKCEAQCAICGKILPVEFLVAAHIKRRADCSLEERKDFKNIVMPACKFGCDNLYEKGYIVVKDGKFTINNKKYIYPGIQSYLNEIDGRRCEVWSEATEKYFEAHNKKFET